MPKLAANQYGKSRVRLMKVTRHQDLHTVKEWNVKILLRGDYESCFRTGDNSEVLPTDTMKNTVYSIARDSVSTNIEEFAEELLAHFLTNYAQADFATIEVAESRWSRLEIEDRSYPTSFEQTAKEQQTTKVSGDRTAAPTITSGLNSLVILKTANSAFTGYLKDGLTTLRETTDRLLGTELTATWNYTTIPKSFDQVRSHVRNALLSTFAEHHSLSVQHTLFAMAEAALASTPEISEVTLTMPNKHCLLVDLSPFGQTNPNEIFVPTDEPHGYIEATVIRGHA